MAEPRAVRTAAVPVTGHDDLLATKLHLPRPRPGFVPRPRLVSRLDEGLARGLVLVCAPAGYGKTVALADWARRSGRPVAWLSLDAGDNDPVRFWRHVVAAVGPVKPGIEGRVLPLFGPPPPSLFEGPVTALINELAAQPGDDKAILILDDYHLIDAEPVHESLLLLLEHLPPGLKVVLASRSDPPLSLGRLRAGGQLAELHAAELRFSAEEAAALLQRVAEGASSALSDADVAVLTARTEGWAAGLQLAGLSLRGQADTAEFVAAFSGSHRYVLDYLAEEVLERLDGQMRDFLLETSVLERLSGELCDAVTGRTGSQALLERVERAGLFLVPLDEVRGWWRYHHLFADLLLARLRRERPARAVVLHRAAAAWYEERDLADDAVPHALAAGDAMWAARLIEQHFDATYHRGQRATIHRWLAALPADLVHARPRLQLAQAWMAVVGGHVEEAGVALDAAQRASAQAAEEPFEPSAGRAASLLANTRAAITVARGWLAWLHGDADGATALASQALGELTDGDWLLTSLGQLELALADRLRGRLDDAERGFTASLAGWRAAGERGSAVSVCELLGRVHLARGRLDAALGTFQLALEIATEPGQPALPAAGVAYAGMAEVEYQRDELNAALSHVTEGIARLRAVNHTAPMATGLARLAWIRRATGDAAGALEAIGEAGRVAPSPAVTGLVNPVPAQRARLLLAQGNVAAAARWTEQHGLSPEDEPSYPHEQEYLVLGRLLLAQDHPGEALALLDRLIAQAAAQDRMGSVIEIQALRALALAADGDEPAAVRTLAEALILAFPQGYVRVFADEGPPMRALLGRVIAARRAGQASVLDIPLRQLARVTEAFDGKPDVPGSRPDGAAGAAGLIDPLTGRELQVLAMLAEGTPNQAIAKELFVTVFTVKKHVSHILAKLGAANRTEAVARARELGLIP
jgi:LuxR family transcriptional regulator, maltose regulon positive regulatory protein